MKAESCLQEKGGTRYAVRCKETQEDKCSQLLSFTESDSLNLEYVAQSQS